MLRQLFNSFRFTKPKQVLKQSLFNYSFFSACLLMCLERTGTVCKASSMALIDFVIFSRYFWKLRVLKTAMPLSVMAYRVLSSENLSSIRPFFIRKSRYRPKTVQSMLVSYAMLSIVKGVFIKTSRIASYDSSFDLRICIRPYSCFNFA